MGVYAVGPLGKNAKAEGEGPVEEDRILLVKDCPEEFLEEVTNTGKNAVCAVLEYNATHARDQERPSIEVVRVPIISGGIFKHPEVEKSEVAFALLQGIHLALASVDASVRPEIQLMPSPEMSIAYSKYMESFSHQCSRLRL